MKRLLDERAPASPTGERNCSPNALPLTTEWGDTNSFTCMAVGACSARPANVSKRTRASSHRRDKTAAAMVTRSARLPADPADPDNTLGLMLINHAKMA